MIAPSLPETIEKSKQEAGAPCLFQCCSGPKRRFTCTGQAADQYRPNIHESHLPTNYILLQVTHRITRMSSSLFFNNKNLLRKSKAYFTNPAQNDSGPFAPIYICLTVLRAGGLQFLVICRRLFECDEKALRPPGAGEPRYFDRPQKGRLYYRSNSDESLPGE